MDQQLSAVHLWEGEAPSARLGELIRQSGVVDISDWKVDFFLNGPPRDGKSGVRLSDVLEVPGYVGKATRGAIEAGLERFAEQLANARASEPAVAERLRLGMPANPIFDPLRAALCALRLPMLRSWPMNLFQATGKPDAVGESLSVPVNFEGDRRYAAGSLEKRVPEHPLPRVTFPRLSRWAEGLALSCSCGKPACVHRALAIDLVLDGTRTNTGAWARLISQLLQPAWKRALGDMFKEPVRHRYGWSESSGPMRISARLEGEWLNVEAWPVEQDPRRHSWGEPWEEDRRWDLARFSGQDRRVAELWSLLGGQCGHSIGDPIHGDVLLALAGHPYVYLADDRFNSPAFQGVESPASVRVETAHVEVVEKEGGVALRVMAGTEEVTELGDHRSSEGPLVLRRGNNELVLYKVPRELERVLASLDDHGMPVFPPDALGALMDSIPRLEASARVELPPQLRGHEEPASTGMVVQVDTANLLVEVTVRSMPLAGGPTFVPGQGADLSAAFDGLRRRFARRDLTGEVERAHALAARLELGNGGDGFRWMLPAGDKGIDALHRISVLLQEGVTVEWKRGPLRFGRTLELDMLKMRIEREADWFGLKGDLESEGARVTLAVLLEAARTRRQWVAVDGSGYARLSRRLAEGLSALAHLQSKNDEVRLPLGAVPLVGALASQVKQFEADQAWKELTDRVTHAQLQEHPAPESLAGVLRDYQREGFAWMSRLAQWGSGAVLADDMGLGKTLQALAVLVSRQALGPALVVAPSSVLHVWKREAEKFAPSLSVRLFNEESGHFPLGPSQVLVVSWTLLAREARHFANSTFSTVVLDEAQAIKNSSTQRAKAAHKLKADFVLALSGTPVENHLGEVWSLFRAVMPGLLGSEDSFKRRYAGSSPEAARALAELVRPFILRRKKSEVARELPPRTDLDVIVPLSPEERELYEDIRLAAAAEVGTVTGEDRRFEVLAALTRLRLAACHPRLVDAGWKGGASKLTRLMELLKDLAAAGHKTLVFSQFTQHLALVREAMQSQQMAFSYLDGQVAPAERQRRVDAFQAGQGGEVFLISLRAGGTGLTITAADYVIHLDPWWNPAVEDQASDRAHRLGQTRPVTVYRLIGERTVEQEILKLHRDKRELVEALLTGTEQVAKLSAAELAALIQGRAVDVAA